MNKRLTICGLQCRKRGGIALIALSLLLISACGHKTTRIARPAAPRNPNTGAGGAAHAAGGYTETGIASWYGIPYHGRRAASGEIFDMEQMTAAHKTLPFQTWVEVTNLDNGEVIVVRINDRGPFVDGRVIDLSKAAAREAGMLQAGLARVRLRVLDTSEIAQRTAPRLKTREPAVVTSSSDHPRAAVLAKTAAPPVLDRPAAETETIPPPRSYAVQAGTFSMRESAEAIARLLAGRFHDARVLPTAGTPTLWRVIVGRSLSLGEAGQIFLSIRGENTEANVIPEPDPGLLSTK